MRNFHGDVLHSASDLNTFLGCAHAAALNLRKLQAPDSLPDKVADDEMAVLVQDAGHAHEADYLATLRANHQLVEIPTEGTLGERALATAVAMEGGAEMIYQAAFLDAPWHGFADFLRRVDEPSKLGGWSYETVDTKLARSANPKHVLQLALYSEMIGKVQGRLPHAMHLMLGDGREESFRTVEFRHILKALERRYLAFIAEGAEGSKPEPCDACSLCGWREKCETEWREMDHLSLVAGIQKGQIAKLRAAGVDNVAALAAQAPDTAIPKLPAETFERLRAQAALQVARRTGAPVVQPLGLELGRGFNRLPAPDPADLFFDLEGDPLHPDGLEYLWGVHYRDAARTPQFRFEWGHDRAGERRAFEAMVDWFTTHVAAHPHAHIYHYAAYEVTVLRRLSTAFASREAAVDALLRAEKFVDLYSVARHAIRTSEPDLSLKTLETFFAETREDEVKKADESIIHYRRWRETGEQALLDGILAYNRVDCANTEGLRDWLLSLRPDLPWWSKSGQMPDAERSEEALQREAEKEALRQAVRCDATRLSEPGRELLAHLIDFHVRAQKPEFWAIYDRCERDPHELVDDGECIGAIEPAGPDWLRDDKRSVIATYRFPNQDTKLREGKTVLHAPTRQRLGDIVNLDRTSGLVEVRRGKAQGEWPEGGSVIPNWPISNRILESAVARVADFLATGSNRATEMETLLDLPPGPANRYQALVDIIERTSPRMQDWSGGPLVQPGETLITAATARALALDSSFLFLQGPPGTGKTFTSAHVIVSLLAAGKRVAVSSNSHKAINNLLAKVEEVANTRGVSIYGAKKVTRSEPDSYLNSTTFYDVERAKDVDEGGYDIVGATAYMLGDVLFDQTFDYLFVDEAGQVSLGHLIAMGACARNIILVGDQMQLGQPIQGAHPGESGLSTLDYLLQGAATIAPDRGILLDTSWRMHPSICGFISEAVYDDRLRSHPDCTRQTLLLKPDAHPAIAPYGIRMIEMDHQGCSQRSDAEVAMAAALIGSLLGTPFVDRQGRRGTIGLDNILVVAPYNMQVIALRDGLPEGARVGTVDKFQGQEAEVVIVSLATSTPDDLPRHIDFFYSKNRLNVSISRARTLAIVLANPRLLELDAKTVEHLRLVNTLAWLNHEANNDGR